MYKNVFTELGRDSTGSVRKIAVVKTDQMEIVNDDRGNVKGYITFVTVVTAGPSLIQHSRLTEELAFGGIIGFP